MTIDRVNKLENAAKVKAKLQATGMDQGMIDVVLEALNETQDRISTQTAEKLEGVVKENVIEDLKNEMEVLARRLTFSEGVIQENEKDKREIRENVDINRVRFNKIKNELEVLKRASKSALSMSEKASADAAKNAESALKLEDLAGLDVSGDGMERLVNMIKLLETNTNRQLSSLGRKVERLALLETEIEELKNNAGGPVDPKNKTGGFSGKALEEFTQVAKQVTHLSEKMTKLELDYEMLEPIKLK